MPRRMQVDEVHAAAMLDRRARLGQRSLEAREIGGTRDEMRAMRFAMEYAKPELLLREWGVRSTVIVFGSARIPSPEQAERILGAAKGRDAVRAAKRRSSWALVVACRLRSAASVLASKSRTVVSTLPLIEVSAPSSVGSAWMTAGRRASSAASIAERASANWPEA